MKKKKILWAPWRVSYITDPDGKGCIFCSKAKSRKDRENYILHRGKKAYALLNIYPYNNGHVMVAPYEHTGDLAELESGAFREMHEIVRELVKRLKKEMKPHGFNVGMNIGRTAGAGFYEHLHMHIVPRWNGDTNFMPVIGGQDVISEALESVYEKLKDR
ncbi:MAG: HIT domain-containing protein [Elusimicrobia bacterium]|nr:HIT domain-containing protein [Elusimicrobiota bacterium]